MQFLISLSLLRQLIGFHQSSAQQHTDASLAPLPDGKVQKQKQHPTARSHRRGASSPYLDLPSLLGKDYDLGADASFKRFSTKSNSEATVLDDYDLPELNPASSTNDQQQANNGGFTEISVGSFGVPSPLMKNEYPGGYGLSYSSDNGLPLYGNIEQGDGDGPKVPMTYANLPISGTLSSSSNIAFDNPNKMIIFQPPSFASSFNSGTDYEKPQQQDQSNFDNFSQHQPQQQQTTPAAQSNNNIHGSDQLSQRQQQQQLGGVNRAETTPTITPNLNNSGPDGPAQPGLFQGQQSSNGVVQPVPYSHYFGVSSGFTQQPSPSYSQPQQQPLNNYQQQGYNIQQPQQQQYHPSGPSDWNNYYYSPSPPPNYYFPQNKQQYSPSPPRFYPASNQQYQTGAGSPFNSYFYPNNSQHQQQIQPNNPPDFFRGTWNIFGKDGLFPSILTTSTTTKPPDDNEEGRFTAIGPDGKKLTDHNSGHIPLAFISESAPDNGDQSRLRGGLLSPLEIQRQQQLEKQNSHLPTKATTTTLLPPLEVLLGTIKPEPSVEAVVPLGPQYWRKIADIQRRISQLDKWKTKFEQEAKDAELAAGVNSASFSRPLYVRPAFPRPVEGEKLSVYSSRPQSKPILGNKEPAGNNEMAIFTVPPLKTARTKLITTPTTTILPILFQHADGFVIASCLGQPLTVSEKEAGDVACCSKHAYNFKRMSCHNGKVVSRIPNYVTLPPTVRPVFSRPRLIASVAPATLVIGGDKRSNPEVKVPSPITQSPFQHYPPLPPLPPPPPSSSSVQGVNSQQHDMLRLPQCGKIVYNIVNKFCCAEKLYDKAPGQVCCANLVYGSSPNETIKCCGMVPYDFVTHTCMNPSMVIRKSE